MFVLIAPQNIVGYSILPFLQGLVGQWLCLHLVGRKGQQGRGRCGRGIEQPTLAPSVATWRSLPSPGAPNQALLFMPAASQR